MQIRASDISQAMLLFLITPTVFRESRPLQPLYLRAEGHVDSETPEQQCHQYPPSLQQEQTEIKA